MFSKKCFLVKGKYLVLEYNPKSNRAVTPWFNPQRDYPYLVSVTSLYNLGCKSDSLGKNFACLVGHTVEVCFMPFVKICSNS